MEDKIIVGTPFCQCCKSQDIYLAGELDGSIYTYQYWNCRECGIQTIFHKSKPITEHTFPLNYNNILDV